MHPADTSSIDEVIATYNGCYPTRYAFYDDVDGVIGDHEEVILRAQMEESPLCGAMEDALPANTAPEEVSAEAFYGGAYFWPKRTLVFYSEKTTKRPMPYYDGATNKAFKPDDYKLLEAYWESLEQDADNISEEDKRYGYAGMFMTSICCDLKVIKLNETFHQLERFMCDDIRRCMILDWRADLAPHCVEEHEYGACGGNYLWTVSCPVKRRVTLIRFHFNWYYA